jgi:hypothetical protein
MFPAPDEAKFISLCTKYGAALLGVYLIRFFDSYSLPIEWSESQNCSVVPNVNALPLLGSFSWLCSFSHRD